MMFLDMTRFFIARKHRRVMLVAGTINAIGAVMLQTKAGFQDGQPLSTLVSGLCMIVAGLFIVGYLRFTYIPLLILDGDILRCNRGIMGKDVVTIHPTGQNVSVRGETLAVQSETGPPFTFHLIQLDATSRDKLLDLLHYRPTSA